MRINGLQNGAGLFNDGRFFDAHEALEDIWREAPWHSTLRRHLQGLVQVAVAFHHQSTGNYVGALSVLKRGLRNLEGAEESLPELDLAKLRTSLKPWREYLEGHGNVRDGRNAIKVVRPVVRQPAPGLPAPDLPQIMLRDDNNF